jgi:hypothetical protein
MTVATASTFVALALFWAQNLALAWVLPVSVLAIGATQWLTLWATHNLRFGLLATARFVQQGGGSMLQVLLGLLQEGPGGLLLAPVLAGLAAAWLLARPAPLGGWQRMWRQPRQRLRAMAARHRDFPLFNTPHAFMGALQDTLTLLLIAAWAGDAAAGFWALALRYLKAPATPLASASQAPPQLVHARSAREAQALARRTMLVLALLAAPLTTVLRSGGQTLRFEHSGNTKRREVLPLHRTALHRLAALRGLLAWRVNLGAAAVARRQAVLSPGCSRLHWDGLEGAAWGVSAAMAAYFLYHFQALAHWSNIPHESSSALSAGLAAALFPHAPGEQPHRPASAAHAHRAQHPRIEGEPGLDLGPCVHRSVQLHRRNGRTAHWRGSANHQLREHRHAQLAPQIRPLGRAYASQRVTCPATLRTHRDRGLSFIGPHSVTRQAATSAKAWWLRPCPRKVPISPSWLVARARHWDAYL